MTKYKRYKDEECALCGCYVRLIETERLAISARGEKHKVCEVCYTTHCGVLLEYSRGDTDTARMIAQVANLILDKIGVGRR